MNLIEHIIIESEKLNIKTSILNKESSLKYIKDVLLKFNVQKNSGHIAIYFNSKSLPIEEFEFTYSSYLQDEEVYMFFDQESLFKNNVIKISESKKVCEILKNCPGVEYFLSNSNKDFLIAVNWYVIEAAGTARHLIEQLSKLSLENKPDGLDY